jgi:hypothetical protein
MRRAQLSASGACRDGADKVEARVRQRREEPLADDLVFVMTRIRVRGHSACSARVSVDIVELNETFVAPAVAVVRDVGLDDAKVIFGGAIALGHPVARRRS